MEQLTFNTRIGYDDIQNQFEYQAKKQRETIQLLCNGKYGIVSDVETSNAESPLSVAIDGNSLQFSSGTIVTKSGKIAYIEDFFVSIPSINQDTIVLYTYKLTGSKEKRLSNSGKAYPVLYTIEKPEKCISFLTIDSYGVLTSDVLDNSVCLAILKYTSDSLVLDFTNSSYEFNRPWFSLCDIEHRNMLGSGSSSVPHSIGLNDLSSNNLTIYEQLLTRGIIISKDLGIAGVPGNFYKNDEDFRVSLESLDDGDTQIKVVNLQDCYPNAIASVTTENGEDVSCHLMKGSNYIIIDDDTPVNTLLHIQMIVTNTLIPQVAGTQVNELLFKAQDPNDTIITQGLETSLKSTEVSFSDCSNFNKNFEIVVNPDGTLHKEPEVISSLRALSKYEMLYISQEFEVPSMLQIIREKEGANSGKVILDFYGTDADGNDLIETVEVSVTGVSTFETKNLFKSVKYIKNHFEKDSIYYKEYSLTADINLVVFAYANRALDRRVRILNLSWNGTTQQFTNLKDVRPISTIIRDPLKVSIVKETANNIINYINIKSISSGNDITAHSILTEDFSSPEYLDANTVTWITTGKGINFPIIQSYVADTSSYTLCYRSRKLKLYEGSSVSSKITLYAYLVQADLETINSQPVRIVMDNREVIMENIGNGLFKAEIDVSNKVYGKLLVTGNALGVSLFRN